MKEKRGGVGYGVLKDRGGLKKGVVIRRGGGGGGLIQDFRYAFQRKAKSN